MVATSRTDNPALATIALFLDVDGTLLEIAARPQAVSVPDELRERLRALYVGSAGAVALVSGRAIADLDALFAPLELPSAGLHGFERRDGSGRYSMRPAPSAAALAAARSTMSQLARQHSGLLVEDKRFALALHYRDAPEAEDAATSAMGELAASLGTELELQRGKMVLELRPVGSNKADAVAAFLGDPPFAGRLPVFIGDDLTDEPAFELVNHREGVSVIVGAERASAARARLADVAAVREWLAQLQTDATGALERLCGPGYAASDADAPGGPAPRASRLLRSQG